MFTLGFQSQSVNGGHYKAAFLTSFAIGSIQMIVFKLAPEAGADEIAAFLLGGPFGITASMYVHRRTIGRRRARSWPFVTDSELSD